MTLVAVTQMSCLNENRISSLLRVVRVSRAAQTAEPAGEPRLIDASLGHRLVGTSGLSLHISR
jgi:hypothetical protein